MTSLADVQANFGRHLLDGDTGLLRSIRGGRGDAARRLAIYRGNVFVSLTNVLQATFPHVLRLLGQTMFRGAAAEFIAKRPPRRPHLSAYGGDFPPFLRNTPPVADHPFIADVGDLEWARHEAFRVGAGPAMSPAALQAERVETLLSARLPLQPSARFVASAYPILQLCATAEGPSTIPVDLAAGGDRLLVFFGGTGVETLRLGLGEDVLLRSVAKGMTLATAAQAAAAADPEMDLQDVLFRHFMRGTFANWSTGSPSQ